MSLLKEIEPYVWRAESGCAYEIVEYVVSEDDLPAIINKVLDKAIEDIDSIPMPENNLNWIAKENVIEVLQALKEGGD